MSEVLMKQAAANLAALRNNPYPGRCVIIGRNLSRKHLVQVSFITGRSGGSRNRRYKYLGRGRVETEVADPNKETGDPEKTIYAAMAGDSRVFVVSNGRQTDTIMNDRGRERGFCEAMRQHTYEDDSISTPRITAFCVIAPGISCTSSMAILRRSPFDESCERNFFEFEKLHPGIGHTLTTYMTDGNPPPTFQGEPYLLPLNGDSPTEIGDRLWKSLNEPNRVCLAVKLVNLETGEPDEPYLINRY